MFLKDFSLVVINFILLNQCVPNYNDRLKSSKFKYKYLMIETKKIRCFSFKTFVAKLECAPRH